MWSASSKASLAKGKMTPQFHPRRERAFQPTTEVLAANPSSFEMMVSGFLKEDLATRHVLVLG